MQSSKKKRLSSTHVETKRVASNMSDKQKSLMLEFLRDHPYMVCDRSVGGTSTKRDRNERWEELACILNHCEKGAQKDGTGWRRSWQDLKRYESLKAKESMGRLDKMPIHLREAPSLELSPLQEKISHLLNTSITDVLGDSGEDIEKAPRSQVNPSDTCQEPITMLSVGKNIACGSENYPPGDRDTESELEVAKALQSIANALTERNVIEERKLKVFESLLSVYAAKSGSIGETVNFESGQRSSTGKSN